MIQLSTERQLSILLPNSNKALAEVLKNATPKQLETIVREKDLRSVVSGLLNDTLQSSKADKVVLDLLKNSPIFKNLSSVTGDLKQLLNLLPKVEGKLTPIHQTLNAFLSKMEQMDPALLQRQINNSGVFLESKLAMSADPKAEVKTMLTQLLSPLKQSDTVLAKSLMHDIKAVLANEQLFIKGDSVPVKALSALLQNIVGQLQQGIQTSDPIRSGLIEQLVEKLLPFTQTDVKNLTTTATLSSNRLQNLFTQLKHELIRSNIPDVKALLQQISQLSAKVSSVSTGQTVTQELSKQLQRVEVQLQTLLQQRSIPSSKPILESLEQLKGMLQTIMTKPDSTPFSSVEKLLNTLTAQLPVSQDIPIKSLPSLIETILMNRPAASVEQLAALKIPQEVRTLLDQLSVLKYQGDAIYSKEVSELMQKLTPFTKAENLLGTTIIKENLSHDVKALLLQMGDEVQKATLPNTSEIMKQMDKLMMQIDYYQLLSHLSSSSALYMPFIWEELEQGSLAFKKGNEDNFYCEIDLQLKEYGELNLMLVLYEENQLNIRAYTEKAKLKEKLIEQMPLLRSALASVNIMPRQIRIFEMQEAEKAQGYDNRDSSVDMGFEVKA